ncbi:MAG: hypothetical protein LBV79_04755 [Candidatus Adiutrix sp.]|jgi:hypothetical protein|nr:hypothetical protein [Candidatus Adiutrix sp.]
MDAREQLLYLLEHFYKGNYTTDIFADEFERIYNLELDYDTLSEAEYMLFHDLSLVAGRFSPFEDDLKIPNVYFSEAEVKDKAAQVYLKLTKTAKSHLINFDSSRKKFFDCCRVCGYRLDFFPWGVYNDTPSFEVCPCCGVQFGVMDETPVLAGQERQDWLNKGMPWFQEDKKPKNWEPEEQLAHIPLEFISG